MNRLILIITMATLLTACASSPQNGVSHRASFNVSLTYVNGLIVKSQCDPGYLPGYSIGYAGFPICLPPNYKENNTYRYMRPGDELEYIAGYSQKPFSSNFQPYYDCSGSEPTCQPYKKTTQK